MKRTKVKELLSSTACGTEVKLQGWVRTFRNNQFIAINDGSTINNIQAVIDFENFDGLSIQVDENGHTTNIDVSSQQRAAPGDPIPGYESCPPFCDSAQDTDVSDTNLE